MRHLPKKSPKTLLPLSLLFMRMIALSHLSEPVEEDLSVSVVLVLRWIFILCASILQVRMSPIFLLPGLRALSDAVLRNLSCSRSRLELPFLVRLRRSVGAGGNFLRRLWLHCIGKQKRKALFLY